MRRSDYPQRSNFRQLPGDEARLPILVFLASLMIALIVLVLVLPRPVVLPAFSLWALAAAASVALVACARPHASASRSVGAWELAGAFTLIGCAAAIFGEIEAIIEYTRPAVPRSKADD